MEGIQIILIVVVVALSTLLFVVGVQVLLIILDLRRALRRLNSMLDDAILGGGMINASKLSGIMEMFKRKKKMHTHGTSDDSFKSS